MANGDVPHNSPTVDMGAPSPETSRGTRQSGVRLYNERLALSLIRRHGSLPKAEIARLTGLSAQTASVILRQLEADGLIVRQRRQRGKIGQPSVPFALDPEGAYSIGLKIGRRSCDLVLIDFAGSVRVHLRESYPFPTPGFILDFVAKGSGKLAWSVPPGRSGRICGLGIATPFELWNWEDEIGAPHEVMQAWRTVDISAEIARRVEWPVYVCNDATAACAAELVFGIGGRFLEYLYIFIGWFIGGGVVLNGTLFPGRSGNAGAIGALPIRELQGGSPAYRQLLKTASIHTLERRLHRAGHDPRPIWESPDDWSAIGSELDGWIDETTDRLAVAAMSAISVIDFQAIVIDGAFPPAVRSRIVAGIKAKVATFDWQGLAPVEIVEGAVGASAREIGGATLPLLANYARDREVLFRETI